MNINTGKLNFQVSPVAIANERLEARMYQPFNNRGPYFYPMSPFAKMPSMKGLGRLGAAVPNYTCPPISEQPGACAWAGTNQLQDSMNNTGFPNDMAGYLAEQQAAWNADGYCSTWQQQQLSCIQALVSGGTSPDMQNAAALDAAVKAALSTTTTPITSGGGSSVAQIPTFTLINETSGETISTGGSFNQGDGFQVVITNAAPNAPVTVTATQNGQSSTSVLGNTNSSGSFQTSGTMGPSAAGSWTEQWSVPAGTGALALAASVSFTVSSTAGSSAASSGASGSSGSAGSSGSTGSGNSGGSNTNVSAAACGLSLGSSDTSSCVNLGFMTVSTDALMVGAAIGAALLFFAGRGK